MQTNNFGYTLRSLLDKDVEWNEEKSYFFHCYFSTYKDWIVYSTKMMDKNFVLYNADKFALTNGRIVHPQKDSFDFWSVEPVNCFRYKLTKNFYYEVVKYPYDKYNVEGLIVEGAYWSNGFIYHVRNEDIDKSLYADQVLEINLFIDHKSKINYGYPDVELKLHDIINLYCPGSSVDRATDF